MLSLSDVKYPYTWGTLLLCTEYLKDWLFTFVKIGYCRLDMGLIMFPICFYMHFHSCCGRVLLLLLLISIKRNRFNTDKE